jgi:hypothetical protein
VRDPRRLRVQGGTAKTVESAKTANLAQLRRSRPDSGLDSSHFLKIRESCDPSVLTAAALARLCAIRADSASKVLFLS